MRSGGKERRCSGVREGKGVQERDIGYDGEETGIPSCTASRERHPG